MNERIKQAFDQSNPQSDEKNRIFREIVRKSEESSDRRTKMEKSYSIRRVCIAGLVAVLVLTSGGGVYAAMKWKTANEAADMLGDKKLAEAFGKQESDMTVEEAGDYRVVLLGVVSGEDITDKIFTSDDGIETDRSYAAVAIEKLDGSEMTYDDEIMVSPLIQGMKPWQFNIATTNGGACSKIVDGIEYRIADMDNIEIFGDREIYLAVTDNGFNFADGYTYNDDTGIIARNEAYEGLNLLFKLSCDPSKADSAAADAYLKSMEEEMSSSEETSESENDTDEASGEENVEWITGENIVGFNAEAVKEKGTFYKDIPLTADKNGDISYKLEFEEGSAKIKIPEDVMFPDGADGLSKEWDWVQINETTIYVSIYNKAQDGAITASVYEVSRKDWDSVVVYQ